MLATKRWHYAFQKSVESNSLRGADYGLTLDWTPAASNRLHASCPEATRQEFPLLYTSA